MTDRMTAGADQAVEYAAAALQHIPVLLAEVDRLQNELHRLREERQRVLKASAAVRRSDLHRQAERTRADLLTALAAVTVDRDGSPVHQLAKAASVAASLIASLLVELKDSGEGVGHLHAELEEARAALSAALAAHDEQVQHLHSVFIRRNTECEPCENALDSSIPDDSSACTDWQRWQAAVELARGVL